MKNIIFSPVKRYLTKYLEKWTIFRIGNCYEVIIFDKYALFIGPQYLAPILTAFFITLLVVCIYNVAIARIPSLAATVVYFLWYVACLVLLGALAVCDPGWQRNSEALLVDGTYCDICDVQKQSTTRHCVECDLCIQSRHHHCLWLGKCIGRHNYCLYLVFNFVWLSYLCVGVSVLSVVLLLKGNL